MAAIADAIAGPFHHAHHEAAHQWFGQNRESGWATCPLTENGLVRVLSSPAYPGRRTMVHDAIRRLIRFRESGEHLATLIRLV